jgi:acyl-CoA synthetase (AMP-forming)/AMP-acid ligase II
MTVTRVLDDALGTDPDRVALVGASRSLTYAELDRAADAAAAALADLGVRPGDRVAASLANDVDIVVAFHGAMRRGAMWVGINGALAPAEKEVLLEAATPVVLLTDVDTAARHRDRWRTVPVDPGDAGAEWSAVLAANAGAARGPEPDPDAPAAIAFTSGTTGDPKGIVHSQRNLVLPGRSIVATRGYDETLRKGDCLPLTILNLQVLTSLLTAAAGGCCIVTDRRDARGVAEWLARESVTVWNGVPALLYSMVHDADLDPGLFGSLAEVWTGGAPCPEDLFAAFETRFGVPLRQTYGLTEAPTVVSMEPVGVPHVPDASGVPLPQLDVRVVDDGDRSVATGELGEIVVRGARDGEWADAYTPMVGYWHGDRVEPFGDDDLRTGDIGVFDDAGNLIVRDRKKLLILRGGANVYPAEVERVLERAPGVRAGAVLGVPDPRLGQRVVAAIEVDAERFGDVRDVEDYCRAHLARYKVPDRIVVVDVLPRNAMGKVQRPLLVPLFEPADGRDAHHTRAAAGGAGGRSAG